MPSSRNDAPLWRRLGPSTRNLRVYQVLVLVLFFAGWYVLTSPTLLPPFYFDQANKAAFFFGEPQKVIARVWTWFVTDADIYRHLWVTLLETLMAFAFGTVLGLVVGLWLALAPVASALRN